MNVLLRAARSPAPPRLSPQPLPALHHASGRSSNALRDPTDESTLSPIRIPDWLRAHLAEPGDAPAAAVR
jgi:hypothetical protein